MKPSYLKKALIDMVHVALRVLPGESPCIHYGPCIEKFVWGVSQDCRLALMILLKMTALYLTIFNELFGVFGSDFSIEVMQK